MKKTSLIKPVLYLLSVLILQDQQAASMLEFGVSNPMGFGSGAIKDIAAAPKVAAAAVATPSGIHIVRQSEGYVPKMVSRGDSWSMALSSTAKWLAVQRVGRVELVDTESGRVRKSWQMQVDERWTAVFSSDDRYMVIAGLRGFGFEDLRPELICFDLETMEELQHHEMFDVYYFSLIYLEISSDGHWTVAITRLQEETRLVVFENWEGGVVYEKVMEENAFDVPWQASFTPDSSKLVWVYNQIHVVDTKLWKDQLIQTRFVFPPFALSNDSSTLVSKGGEVYNLVQLPFQGSLPKWDSTISPVTMEFSSGDAFLLISGFPGNLTKIYNMETQSFTRSIEMDWGAFNGWNGREFRPRFIDSQHFLHYSSGSGLEIRSVNGVAGDIAFDSNLGEIRQLSENADTGDVISFSSTNQTPGTRVFQSWSSAGNRSGKSIVIENGFDATISSNGHYAFVAARNDVKISLSVFDLNDFSLSRTIGLDRSHMGFDIVGAISNDGQIVALGRDSGNVEIYGDAAKETTLTLSKSDPIRTLIYSPDNEFLAARTQAGKVGVWHVLSWEMAGEFDTEDDFLAPIVFSHDSRHLLAKTNIGMLDYDMENSELRRLNTSPYFSGQLTLSPDGNWLAGPTFNEVVLWNRYAQAKLHSFRFSGETDGVTAMTFSRDGKAIFAGTGNGRIVRWDLGGLFPDQQLSVESMGGASIQLSWQRFPSGTVVLLESSDLSQWKEVPMDERAGSLILPSDAPAMFYKLSYRADDAP